MKKKQKKKRSDSVKSSKSRFTGLAEFIAAAALLLAVVLIATLTRSCGVEEDSGEETDTQDNFQAEIIPIYNDKTPIFNSLNPESVTLPIEIKDNVFLTSLYSASAEYPEDASDEYVENVLCAEFTNDSSRTVEYMTAAVTIDGIEYSFAVTTIPPNETVRAFEKERKIAPEKAQNVSVSGEYLIFFTEEPSVFGETLEFVYQNGTIVVKNISNSDISSDIVVYYKTKTDDIYYGGITYRLRITGGLEAGESFNGYAPHSSETDTKVMFVDYEE